MKSKGRLLFEYGMAAVITGCVTPCIHKMYNDTFCKMDKKLSLTVDDFINMDDDEDDDEE